MEPSFQRVRTTCNKAAEAALHVKINQENLATFASQLDADAVRAKIAGLEGSENAQMEVQGDTRHRANYAVVYSMLQLGHGFRRELHAAVGGGASKTMTSGMNSLATGQLDAILLANLSMAEIDSHFKIPSSSALDPLRKQVLECLNEAGRGVLAAGEVDFHDLVRKAALACPERPADTVVSALAAAVPCFNDLGEASDGTAVCLYKKAILAATELHRTLGSVDSAFHYADIANAPAVVDNVVPAMLCKSGVLTMAEALEQRVRSKCDLPRGVEEAELRACAIAAIERISQQTGGKLAPTELSTYLWLIGKDGDNRTWERHHTKDTVFY